MQLKTIRLDAVAVLVGASLIAGLASINSAQQANCKSQNNKVRKESAHKASLTGAYDCKQGRNESSLYVKEQAPGRIQFALKSLWIGNAATGNVHTGQAGGFVELKDNKGSFKNEYFSLAFTFTAGHCLVACTNCSGFGGVNVDPNGTYKKVNSAVPSARDLEVDQ